MNGNVKQCMDQDNLAAKQLPISEVKAANGDFTDSAAASVQTSRGIPKMHPNTLRSNRPVSEGTGSLNSSCRLLAPATLHCHYASQTYEHLRHC